MAITTHLVSYTAITADGSTEYGVARVSTNSDRPTVADCARAVPGLADAEYLGPEPAYLLRYRTADGVREHRLCARAVGVVGQLVSRLADREEAWGIEVLDEAGHDITFDFPVFRG